MMYFSRWKTFSILGVCLAALLLSLPNLFPRASAPEWFPMRQVNLGLDLRGGSYLLLEVDTSVLLRERLEAVVEGTRRGLGQATPRISYTGLTAQPDQRRVQLRITDPAQRDTALRIIRELANPVTVSAGNQQPDMEVAAGPDGTITATITEAGLRAKATNAVEQSIEIVRRRIDETGVAEALIARQGANRILVQLPGVEDPQRIKDLLGRTARMTFHLLDETANLQAITAPPGVMFLTGEQTGERFAVRRRVEVDGANLNDARAAQDSRTGEWVVNFSFDSIGTRRFADITRANVGRPFAIVLDDRVITAP